MCEFRASAGGTAPLSLCQALLLCSLQAGAILSVLSCLPTWPNPNLHWPGDIHSLYPGDSLGTQTIKLMNSCRHIPAWATRPTHPLGRWLFQQQSIGLSLRASKDNSGGVQLALTQAAVFLGQISGICGLNVGKNYPQCDSRILRVATDSALGPNLKLR